MMDKIPAIKAQHISLYLALFRLWNRNRFKNPITVCREELMNMAKIGSRNTYVKNLRDLQKQGFLKYMPSHDITLGSKVYLYRFDTTAGTELGPLLGSQMSPLYKHTNNTHTLSRFNDYDNNEKEIDNSTQNTSSMKNQKRDKMIQTSIPEFGDFQEWVPDKIQKEKRKKKKKDIPPPLEHVHIYFLEKGHPANEAERFFNYYQSNGWKVGGKAKMKDWKAAARNWMLNIKKYETNTSVTERSRSNLKPPGHEPSGYYDEPL